MHSLHRSCNMRQLWTSCFHWKYGESSSNKTTGEGGKEVLGTYENIQYTLNTGKSDKGGYSVTVAVSVAAAVALGVGVGVAGVALP